MNLSFSIKTFFSLSQTFIDTLSTFSEHSIEKIEKMADADAQRAAAAAQAKEDARLMREAAQDPTKIHVVLDEAFKNKKFLKVHQKLTYVLKRCVHCI